jgi:hypothetical protein
MAENDQSHPIRRPFFFRFPDELRERLALEAQAIDITPTCSRFWSAKSSAPSHRSVASR